jgi:hypothetical protein
MAELSLMRPTGSRVPLAVLERNVRYKEARIAISNRGRAGNRR